MAETVCILSALVGFACYIYSIWFGDIARINIHNNITALDNYHKSGKTRRSDTEIVYGPVFINTQINEAFSEGHITKQEKDELLQELNAVIEYKYK